MKTRALAKNKGRAKRYIMYQKGLNLLHGFLPAGCSTKNIKKEM
jgi:hypothetical protein